jgi:hypothetical protein
MSPILGSSTKISPSSSNSHGRTIVYNSTAKTHANVGHHQQQQQQQQITTKNNVISCSGKTVAVTSFDDSSTGRVRGGFNKADENGNSVQIVGVQSLSNSPPKLSQQPLILHHKSPVPSPRSASNQKVSMTLVKITPLTTDIDCRPVKPQQQQQNLSTANCYSSLLMRNQNSQPIEQQQRDATNNNIKKAETTRKLCENEMREKLLSEMFGKSSNLVEASNPHIKFRNGSNLKRSSSFDVLNDISADKIDKKVVFQEILLSELSELRRETRLSSAKSSPDISPNGNLNIFDIDLEKKSLNTFLSLEDSGVEDEGKMDDWSSSGVGDSWDSCKEIENR